LSRNIKKTLKILLPLLLGVFLVWFALSKVSIDELIFYLKKADYKWIVLGVFFGFLSHLSRAYRWRFMLDPLGYKIKLENSIMAVFAAYLINFTIPRAGEIARASVLTNYENVPFEKGFGTIVSERIADVVVMMGIIALTLFLQFEFIYDFFIQRFNPLKIGASVLLLITVVFIAFKIVKRSQSRFAKKIKGFFNGLLEGILSIFKMKKKWPFVLHTLFIWGMYILMFYATSFSIAELEGISIGAILIGFISASFSIAATNGGIGSYPLAIYAAFSIFSIAKEPSLAFGWIVWASQTLLIIVFGGISLIYLPIYNRKRAAKERSNSIKEV
jgi:uncharacterized protein (TIRG00374 family)